MAAAAGQRAWLGAPAGRRGERGELLHRHLAARDAGTRRRSPSPRPGCATIVRSRMPAGRPTPHHVAPAGISTKPRSGSSGSPASVVELRCAPSATPAITTASAAAHCAALAACRRRGITVPRPSWRRRTPAVPAGAGVEVGLGHVERGSGPPSRNSRRRSSGRGSAAVAVDWSSRLTQPGLEASVAGPREVRRAPDRRRRRRAVLRCSGGRARCTPTRRCRRSTTLRCAAAGRTPAGGRRRTPAARTAASRRDACRRCVRSPSSARRTRSTPPCARGCGARAADRAPADRTSGRSPRPATRRSIDGTSRLRSGTHSSLS